MKAGAVELGHSAKDAIGSVPQSGMNRGLSILDLFLRIIALIATLGSAIAMGTTNETLPFSLSSFVSRRNITTFPPSRTFFVVANSIVSAYLVLSLVLSIYHIMRSRAQASRIALIFFDTAMLTLLTAGASASAAILYLAHNGNTKSNWLAICQQYDSFCRRTSGFFGGIVLFILLILLSAISFPRR